MKMNRTAWAGAILVLLLLAALLVAATLSAQGPLFSVNWWTVDAGGGTSGDGTYSVSGTAGQPDALGGATDGQYTVTGGFWQSSVVTPGYQVYLPSVIRQ